MGVVNQVQWMPALASGRAVSALVDRALLDFPAGVSLCLDFNHAGFYLRLDRKYGEIYRQAVCLRCPAVLAEVRL